MAYSTQIDLEMACGGARRLVELTDWDSTGVLDVVKMNAAIAEADAEIDSYLVKQFLVPLGAPIPAQIVKLSARLAVYRLRLARGTVNEALAALAYEKDVQWLSAVAKGDVSIGVNPQPAPSTMRAVDGASERPTTKAISRRKLHGFS